MRTRTMLLLAGAALLAACQDDPASTLVPQPDDISRSGAAAAAPSTTGGTIVNFASGIPAGFADLVAAAGGEVVFAFPQISVAIIRGISTPALANLLRPYQVTSYGPERLYAIPVPEGAPRGSRTLPGGVLSGGAEFSALWGLRMIEADRAIDAGHTGRGALIGIVDSGIDYTHPDLDDNYLGGRNFWAPYCDFDPPGLPGNCDPEDPQDHNGHGTHVSGTIAAELNGFGVVGVAPDAKLLGAKVCGYFGWCTDGALIAGIMWAADQGVDAINLSIGGYLFVNHFPEDRATFVAFMRATNYAHQRGTLVVNSAGNAGVDLQHLPGFIKRIFGEQNNMLVVSALGPDRQLANFFGWVYSNWGNIIDVSAPGGSYPPLEDLILSTVPYGDGYDWYAGTSMATPHVTGTAAQIVGRFGRMHPSQLRTRIQQSAVDHGKRGRDPFYGHGIVNVWNAVR